MLLFRCASWHGIPILPAVNVARRAPAENSPPPPIFSAPPAVPLLNQQSTVFLNSISPAKIFVPKQQPLFDPNLDPVLLVPGIAGSILNAVDSDGNKERVWVRILGADCEFRKKLWSRFDPATGKTVSLDEKIEIVVPEDRHGLHSIDVLDPDLVSTK
ncbi:Lecithin-cholesterol acyltransferase-like 4 [Platanthera guangdongensis]|uniref:Lecithin-cholesterol acyltransferase-like 4 n=1 Tax=Platanthera guangdongensis TaxID=2320717 RepID=A0ABR2MY96_9ASPA